MDMERKLYDTCLEGDVEMLEALMREDKLTLARVSISSCINQTPLHLASMLGHFELAEALLSYKPDFASRLDSEGRSPLHMASANGYTNIVKLLVDKDLSMCRVSDYDGRTPLHLAVMNGQHETVSELIKVGSVLDQEETVLHLCVTYNRLKVLILIIESVNQDLSNIKDKKGNTILHSATSLRQIQIIKYLVTSTEVDVDGVNENGLTALDIIEEMPKDAKTMEVKELLISAGALRAKDIEEARSSLILDVGGGVADDKIETTARRDSNGKLRRIWKRTKMFSIFRRKREKGDKTLLIAATVIAAMAYQAAISPPGGVAGLDATEVGAPGGSRSGKIYDLEPADSLLAYFYTSLSDAFWISNTISFVGALSVIFLYVSGSSLKRRVFIWILRAAMWITLSSMLYAYDCAVQTTTPYRWSDKTGIAIACALISWMGLISLTLLVIVFRFVLDIILKMIRKIRSMRGKKKNTSEEAATLRRTPNNNIV